MTRLRVVIYEGEGAVPLPAGRRAALAAALLARGHAVSRPVPGSALRPADPDEVHVLLGRFDVLPVDDPPRVRVLDVGDGAPDAVADAVTALALAPERPWKPWFPVIDHDRCTNCMQCLTFCLFDVYGVSAAGGIEVRNPRNCKTDCPACARVCPEAAIQFPKYAKGPINGDEVRDLDLQREAMKVDISALLGGDVYGLLRERTTEARARFSTERDASKALLERKRCLAKLGAALDIPDEVLMTLPSSEDIEARARRAREKEAARQARSRSVADRAPAPSEDDWGI